VAQLTPKDMEQPRSVQVKVSRILDNVQRFHETGNKSRGLASDARRKFDKKSPIGPERMRRARGFAEEYDEVALKRFLGHRKPNGLPLRSPSGSAVASIVSNPDVPDGRPSWHPQGAIRQRPEGRVQQGIERAESQHRHHDPAGCRVGVEDKVHRSTPEVNRSRQPRDDRGRRDGSHFQERSRPLAE
jgi:hypothetical protein